MRPAPCPLPLPVKSRNKFSHQSPVYRQESHDLKTISAPLKSVPRPVARKQLSAPASTSQIPTINPPKNGIQKIVKDVQSTTNPFLNGLINFESIKTNFFSTTVAECKIENERATRSAFVSKNPFINSLSGDNNVFDFNPNTIKSILEETPDDGYLGDNDENDEADPLKQLEERIQKLEASGKQRRKSECCSPPRFSPKPVVSKSTSNSTSENSSFPTDLTPNVNAKFVDSPFNDDNIAKSYRKHIRNRSFSENEARDMNVFPEHGDYGEQTSPVSVAPSSTNPFINGKRLLKAPSETYLEQYSMMRANSMVNSTVISNKSTQLCKHPSLSKILQISPPLFEGDESTQNLSIKRAASTESISSESSVIFNKLERTTPPVTGNLCIALQYDK